VGCTLRQHYATEEQARELISHGDISALYQKIRPTNDWKHDFDTPQKGVTVFYHRDRGDALHISEYSSVSEFTDALDHYPYVYLYSGGEWHDAERSD
jgi:hypothetical protein